MSNDSKNGYVKWTTFAFIAMLFIAILGVIWNTLENVRSDISTVKSDVAVIKSQLNLKDSATSLLNRMYNE